MLDLIMNIRVNDKAINDYSVDIKLFLIVLAEMLKYKVKRYML